ncbi:hypothetical protein [Thermofilum sp.]|uniref:hypothetical protein n=1 Tax=Thermofilum sp. TaxID=1961369 RepID=UPI003160082F
MSLGAVLYGVPVYRESSNTHSVKVPLVKIHLYNDIVANAYNYLVYKFSQYAYLRRGFIVRNYDPSSGTIDVEVPEETHLEGKSVEDDVQSLFREFLQQYFLPRLTDRIRRAKLDDLLSVFYLRWKPRGKQTGLASLILPLKYVEPYVKIVEALLTKKEKKIVKAPSKNEEKKNSSKWAIQRGSVESFLLKKKDILERVQALRSKGLGDDDLVVVEKDGGVRHLKIIELQEQLESPPNFGEDLKFVSRAMKCCYCGSKIEGLSFSATGRLGVGRYRLPQEGRTDLSNEARICPRCVLVSMYYILEGGEKTLTYTLNGLLSVIMVGDMISRGTTVDLAIGLGKHMEERPTEWTASMVMNSAFGEERAKVYVESLDEVAIERLALLVYAFPRALKNKNVQRILINYLRSDFSSFISYLVYILKQSKKGGMV